MRGKRIRLSPMRRFVCDLMRASKSAPTVPVQRRMHLANVIAARAAHPSRPSWSAIFIKAYAKVASEMQELRRAYVKLPWPHIYEYPANVASLAIKREYAGEDVVFIGRIKNPDRIPLIEASRIVRDLQTMPVLDCKDFRRELRVSRLPWPFRGLLWWLGLNIGRQRGNYFGTFAISAYSALGAESLHPLSPITTTITYGVIDPDGSVDVRIIYDHRVTDGVTIARALEKLEDELTTDICDELRAGALASKLAA